MAVFVTFWQNLENSYFKVVVKPHWVNAINLETTFFCSRHKVGETNVLSDLTFVHFKHKY